MGDSKWKHGYKIVKLLNRRVDKESLMGRNKFINISYLQHMDPAYKIHVILKQRSGNGL